MLKIAVVDDEQNTLKMLSEIITQTFKKYNIEHNLTPFLSSVEFLNCHMEIPFDVVFLDIMMPELSGFNLAEKLRTELSKIIIIFITNEDGLVFESLDYQPFNFIKKSGKELMTEKLGHIVLKMKNYIKQYEDIILYLPGNEVRKVCAKNIKYIKSTQNYLEYHLTIDNKKEILHIRDKLDNAEAKMNIYDFFRIHRRFLINLSYITETDYSNGIIFLGDEEISLSRNNKESFIEKYKLYLRSLR